MERGSSAGGNRRGCGRGVVGWLAIIAVVTAVVTAVVGAPVRTQAAWGATVTAGELYLRAEPGTWAPIVGQVWQGEYVALLAGPTPDGWYQAQVGDRTGWAFGGGLALDGEGSAHGQGLGAGGGAGGGAERWVDVNRTSQIVTLYEGDVAVAAYWAAMGSDPSDDGFFATAVGTYAVYEKVEGVSWTDWGAAWVGAWVGFDPARLNGFHTYALDAAGDVLLGGDGPTGGCVALAPEAAHQLFAFVSVGTRVEVHH